MATSKFYRYFQAAGVPLTTATIWLVPQANTYPTGALSLTAHGTRDGIYYRDNVPDGEYKVYIDPAGGSSPTLYEEKLWIGEQRVSTISDHFDPADSYKLKTTGIKDSAVTAAKLATDAVETAKIKDLNVTNAKIADNTVQPAKLAQQTVTVISETNPTPSYIGQPGIDTNGKWWTAIALTGTMWKRITEKADEIFSENLNTNYRWENGLTDNSKFNAYFPYNVPTIEENNTVFNYLGRCAKGIASGSSHGVHLANFIKSDIPHYAQTKLALKMEIYIPAATSVEVNTFVMNPGQTFVNEKSFSAGTHIYEIIIDISGYSALTEIFIYYQFATGTVEDIRIGRVYLGSDIQGMFDGSDKEIEHRIKTNSEILRVEHPNLKPEDLLNNEISFIFEPDVIDLIKPHTPSNSLPLLEIVDLDMVDMVLPFTKAVRVYFDAPIPVNSYPGFMWETKWRPKFFASVWVAAVADNYDYGFWIRTCKGYNDNVIETIYCLFTFTAVNMAAIKAAVDSTGVYESVQTGYTKRCRGYINYKGKEYFHIECEITTDLSETDYILLSFGDVNRVRGTGTQPELLVFGMQIFEDAPVNQFNGQVGYKSIQQQAINELLASKLNSSYEYDNRLIDFFNGGGHVYAQDGVTPKNWHNGVFTLFSGGVIDKIHHEKFHEGFEITDVDDDPLLKFVSGGTPNNLIFFQPNNRITSEEFALAHIGFWIDRRELNGNGLVFSPSSMSPYYIRGEDLISKGWKESMVVPGNPPIIGYEVDEVDGYFSHLVYHLHITSNKDWGIAIYNTSANAVYKLTVYNPTLIYHDKIDPYYRYKSLAEKNRSLWIGKSLTYIGDSNFMDGVMACELARHYGFNTIDSAYGSHHMAYSSFSVWFYRTALRDLVLALPKVDVIIVAVSSNDGYGGGSSSESAVKDVIDNYPYYGDDAPTIAAKLALFAAMSEGERQTMFTYKACYSAYLKQLHTAFPEIRIILGSIPMGVAPTSVTGDPDENGWGVWEVGHNADTERAADQTGFLSKRADIISLSEKHMCNFVDFYKESGLTYENFLRYSVDGVHWNLEIAYRLARSAVQEVEKLYY